jgi:predicted phosphoadenosine phosphosulfate sulfurtransferase
MYNADEYNSAVKVAEAFKARATEVVKIFSSSEAVEWFDECDWISVDTQTLYGKTRVIVALWRRAEPSSAPLSPVLHWFRFPMELMNLSDVDIPETYAKWRKEQEKRAPA